MGNLDGKVVVLTSLGKSCESNPVTGFGPTAAMAVVKSSRTAWLPGAADTVHCVGCGLLDLPVPRGSD